MNLKPRRSTLYLLLMSALVMDSAMAQSGRTPGVWDWKAKFAEDYHAHKFKEAIADADALQRLHATDAQMMRVTAQAYYLSGDKPGCVKYIRDNFDPSVDQTMALLLKRCQTG